MSDNVVRRRMMVDNQIRPSDVTKFPIIEAFLSIKREVLFHQRIEIRRMLENIFVLEMTE